MSKKTHLYDEHLKLGAKIVEFAGWEMPVQYSGIIDEHNTVRNHAGLFDVSHMGEFFVSGNDALTLLQKLVPQDISKLTDFKAVYCQLPNKNGGLIDDLIIYKLENEKYLVIVNASGIEKDFEWFKSNANGLDVELENKSEEYSLLALQGPDAKKIIEKMGIKEQDQPKFFHIKKANLDGVEIFLARTGYTGEDGFEVLMKNEYAAKLWNSILKNGAEFGIKPIGLGARDTLRLEAALPLYGNDLNEETTPVESGLSWFIPKDKEADYNGKAKILEQLKNGVTKHLIGFKMTDRAIPRHEYELYIHGKKAGIVTSGGFAPTLNENIGLGYIEKELPVGSDIQVMVRNKLYNAKVVKTPFVQKKSKIKS